MGGATIDIVMRTLVPRTIRERIWFYRLRIAQWFARKAEIGVPEERLAELEADIAAVTYRITALRGTRSGTPAHFTVRLGNAMAA